MTNSKTPSVNSLVRTFPIMKNLTAATRIAIGLVCSTIGILITANFLGLLPDRHVDLTKSRAELTESLAFSTSLLLTADDRPAIKMLLENIVERQHQVLSTGVRRADGVMVAIAGNHEALWPASAGESSNTRFMQVPLSDPNGDIWGRLEVTFTPLDSGRWYAFAENPHLQLLAFVTIAGFLSFRLFLKFVLKNLDPSKAVPRRVREALDILNEGLMIVSVDDRILLANNALAATSERSADSLVGLKASVLNLQRSDEKADMPWTECSHTSCAVTGVTMDFTGRGGKKQMFKVNCSPLFGNDGRIRGVMVSLDDVTQLEQNKIDLRIAKDEADQANKAKGDFLANMSHEIRNPMNAIVGFTDILRRGLAETEDDRITYLDTIHASGTHLVELINDILDFSKIESGKLELEIRDCNPWQIMTEVVNVLRMKADQQLLDLSISIRGKIPEIIQADPTRLRQILMNLVSNAIKFTAEGSVTITASMVEQNSTPFIRFEVRDTGIGMTKEQMSRLFQGFMQADSSVTRRFGGTGLGLAISKRLTEAIGGQIAVESDPGAGSTFHFSIPTGDLAGVLMLNQADASAKSQNDSRSRQQGLTMWFKPARVLVTDDTAANRQLVGLVLRRAGLLVDEAENGAVAVEKATSISYDLLLMDMQMPVMDGMTAARTLRERGLTQPIVALTANVMQQDRQRCLDAGCTGFLPKPINIDHLLNMLAEYLPTQDVPPESAVIAPVADKLAETRSCLPVKAADQPVAISNDPAALPRITNTPSDSFLDDLSDLLKIATETSQNLGEPATPDSVPTASPRRPRQLMQSTLPLAVPEFRDVVESFVSSIDGTMRELRTAHQKRNYQEIREVAHRLKGTGGTVGFGAFTEPSHKLQMAAEARDDETIAAMLTELEEISACLESPVEV